MSLEAFEILSLIYSIILLLCLYWTIYKIVTLLLFFHYSPSQKRQYTRWCNFLSEISKEESVDSQNESVQRNNIEGVKGWVKCLIQQYHPIGILYYSIKNKTTPTISGSTTLIIMVISYLVISSLFELILNACKNEVKVSLWIAITILSISFILAISFCIIMLTQKYLKGRVDIGIKEMAKVVDGSKNDTQTRQDYSVKNSAIEIICTEDKNYSEYYHSITINELIFSVFIIFTCIISGFIICISNVLSIREIKLYLLGALITLILDLIILRPVFVLILGVRYRRIERTNEVQLFEHWVVPKEVSYPNSNKKCSDIDFSFATSEFNVVLNKWRKNRNLTIGPQQGSSTIMPLESIVIDPNQSNVQLNHIKEVNQHHLETIKDDVDGENVYTGRQVSSGDKENFNTKQKENQLKKQELLSKTSSIASNNRINALLYCSPLRENTKLNQYFIPESLFHTSPKKAKGQFVPDIKDCKASSIGKESLNELSYSEDNISQFNTNENVEQQRNVYNSQITNHLPRGINKDRADLLTLLRPSNFNRHRRLLSKGSILNISDFDNSIGIDKSKLSHINSHNTSKPIMMEEDKVGIKNYEEEISSVSVIAQDIRSKVDEQLDTAAKIKRILEPRRNQSKCFESVLDSFPYLNDSLLLQRPPGSIYINRAKSRERDIRRINNLIYSRKEQRQATSIGPKEPSIIRDQLLTRTGQDVINKDLLKINMGFDRIKQSFKRSKHKDTRYANGLNETNENINDFKLINKNEANKNYSGNTTTNLPL